VRNNDAVDVISLIHAHDVTQTPQPSSKLLSLLPQNHRLRYAWPLHVASVRTAPGGPQLLPIHSSFSFFFFSSPPPPLNTHTAARPAPLSTAREALLPTRPRAFVRPSGLRTKPGGTPSAPPSEMWKLRIVVRAPPNRPSLCRSVYVVTAHSLTAFSFSCPGTHSHTPLHHPRGHYACACCGHVLFPGGAKFDAGNGCAFFGREVVHSSGE
jgi:hypothetical protein